jgi:uncharacterized OsmC-like protein
MSEVNNGVDLSNLQGLLAAVKQDPNAGNVRFCATSTWQGGTRTEVTISKLLAGGQDIARPGRQFKLVVDEPPQLGGTDEAPNPVEYIAAGLCGCITAGIATNAAMFGTALEGIEVTVEMEFNLHGVLGLDKSVPNGATAMTYTVKLKGAGDPEKMLRSKQTIDGKSPVLNTLKHPFAISTEASVVK